MGGARTRYTQHPNPLLPLLPSGPGGVCNFSSLGNRCKHHKLAYLIGCEAYIKLYVFDMPETVRPITPKKDNY